MTYAVLTIAGTDPTSGAGIAADIKTLSALGGYALSCVTAVVAQNSRHVGETVTMAAHVVSQQIDMAFQEMPVRSIKIGMIGSNSIAEKLTVLLPSFSKIPIVYDPVLKASSGGRLHKENLSQDILEKLIKTVTLITPNLRESAILLKRAEARTVAEMKEQAIMLHKLGVPWVLLKGGHLSDQEICTDVLVGPGEQCHFYSHDRVKTLHGRGTGCTLSSALAFFMIDHPVPQAVSRARNYLIKTLKTADALKLVPEHGPLNHYG
ncbi:bifunctional hydroxymethylpyrimidine kinase/phosphomethylpyrimidine kinase [Saccharibacter floricola]|uniref:hydroxymethylpyrimidine kinase n=1 Tax=Saccharibacter floricola DSM 15669 TaxID=1123227 RepID=A0ABQ0NWS4_9PROT|nr:bifunctional hydroxymethylpyrimidine kinase/phosphomethylpyrimidine kinase [Saccharibacter floricola]GBQ04929.1 phosphomethylpyrimidine kinase [Saccharibacter floricola DSM 15669]